MEEESTQKLIRTCDPKILKTEPDEEFLKLQNIIEYQFKELKYTEIEQP
jgi:hypothetical protein